MEIENLFKKPLSYKSMSECLEWNLTLKEVRFTEVDKLLRKIFNLLSKMENYYIFRREKFYRNIRGKK